MAMKINKYPAPKGMPERNGTTQWMFGDEVQPTQKREMTYNGPPMQASGRRRYSSILVQLALRALARARNRSYQIKTKQAQIAPMPTLRNG